MLLSVPVHYSNHKIKEGRKERKEKKRKKKEFDMERKKERKQEKESIYIPVPIHDPLLIYPSPLLGILQHHHLCSSPWPTHTPQLLPFTLINHLAVAFVYTLCRCISATFKPLKVGIHNSRTVVVIPVMKIKVLELRAAGKAFLMPSSKCSHCYRACRLVAHQSLSIKFSS